MKVTVLMMRRSFQGTSWYVDYSCEVHHQMPPSCEVGGETNISAFLFLLPPVTLYDFRILQDYGILLVTGRWRSRVEFFFNSEVFQITKCKSQKKCSTHFWVTDTPFKQPTHFPQKNLCQKSGKIGESSPPPAWFRPLSWWIAVPKDLPDQRCHP